MIVDWLRIAGLALTIAAAAPAAAGSLFVGSGSWGPDVETTLHAAPGATFAFSFRLPTPVPGAQLTPDIYFTTAISGFSFTLDGRPVADPLVQLYFYGANGGLFDMIFDVDAINLFGDDVGSTGIIAYDSFPVDYGQGGNPGLGSGSLTISAVPEPATWGLMVAGFGAGGLALRRIRRTAVPAAG